MNFDHLSTILSAFGPSLKNHLWQSSVFANGRRVSDAWDAKELRTDSLLGLACCDLATKLTCSAEVRFHAPSLQRALDPSSTV